VELHVFVTNYPPLVIDKMEIFMTVEELNHNVEGIWVLFVIVKELPLTYWGKHTYKSSSHLLKK
jgi:hypothetical protein